MTEGRCISCTSPCATCYGLPNFCTSCQPGFIRRGQKCRNSTYIAFSFVLTASINIIVADIDNIVIGIYLLLMPSQSNQNSSTYDTSFIDLEEIFTGSTVISGAAAPTGVSVSAASTTLSSGLQNGIPGTSYVVTSSQVSVQSDATAEQS